MTSIASLISFNGYKWVIWCNIKMIFLVFSNKLLNFKNFSKFQTFKNPSTVFSFWGVWRLGLMKVTKLFRPYCQSFKLNGTLGIKVSWKSDFFSRKSGFLQISSSFTLTWLVKCNWQPESTKRPNFLIKCFDKLHERWQHSFVLSSSMHFLY